MSEPRTAAEIVAEIKDYRDGTSPLLPLRDLLTLVEEIERLQAWDTPCPSCRGEEGRETGSIAGWVAAPCTCHPARQEIERLKADIHICPTCKMPCKLCECVEKEAEQLTADRDSLRATNARLNRRCQEAEAALPSWREIADKAGTLCGGSLGRKAVAYGIKLVADENKRLAAENTRLRAALANSELPCVYCTLPAAEMAKCPSGFPGCGRADDAMGCPELGAKMEVERLKAENDALKCNVLDAVGDFVLERWDKTDAEVQKATVAALLLKLNEANAENTKQATALGEWWRAANRLRNGDETAAHDLIELSLGNGFCDAPPSMVEVLTGRSEAAEARCAELAEIGQRMAGYNQLSLASRLAMVHADCVFCGTKGGQPCPDSCPVARLAKLRDSSPPP